MVDDHSYCGRCSKHADDCWCRPLNIEAEADLCPDAESCGEPAGERVTEHAQRYAGGSMLVWPDHPELLRIFPLAERIKAGQMEGGRVFRRTVIVVEDWTEVPR